MNVCSWMSSFVLTTAVFLFFPSSAWCCSENITEMSTVNNINAPSCLILEGTIYQDYQNPNVKISNHCTETAIVDCLLNNSKIACQEPLELPPGKTGTFTFPDRTVINTSNRQYTLTFQIGTEPTKAIVRTTPIGSQGTGDCELGGYMTCSISQAPGTPSQAPWMACFALVGMAALIKLRRSHELLPFRTIFKTRNKKA
jgi:hypothetical protein